MQIKITGNFLKKLIWPVTLGIEFIKFIRKSAKDVDYEFLKVFGAIFGIVVGSMSIFVFGIILLVEGFHFWMFVYWWFSVVLTWASIEFVSEF